MRRARGSRGLAVAIGLVAMTATPASASNTDWLALKTLNIAR